MKLLKTGIIYFSTGILILLFVIVEAKRHGDFKVFIEAAKMLQVRQNMYTPWLDAGCCKYYYSPFFALILIPFTSLPDFVVNFIWLLANVFFCARIWKITQTYFNFSKFTKKEYRLFIILTLLLILRFVLHNFEMVQMNIFVLWAILEGLSLINKKRYIPGAFLIALAINIKILPIVFLPYLIFRRKFISCLWIILFSIMFIYIPALFIGIEYTNYITLEWFKVLNPFNTEQNIDIYLGGESLTSFLPPLLMKTGGELPLKRNIANLDLSTVNFIMTAIRAFFVAFTLYFTGLSFFKSAKSKFHEFYEISYITLIIPIIFPHQEKYAFILLFPATAYIVYFLIYSRRNQETVSKRKWTMLVCLLCLSFILNTLSSDLFIGKYYSNITQHYKTITYGTFLLIAILPFCNPSLLINKKQGSVATLNG